MVQPFEMQQPEVEPSRNKTASAARRFGHVVMASVLLAAFALCSVLMYATFRPLPTSHHASSGFHDQQSEAAPVSEHSSPGQQTVKMFEADNIKLSMKDLLGKLAPSFKEPERLVRTLRLCNSVDEFQNHYTQTSLGGWDMEENMSRMKDREDVFIPVTFGHLPIRCVPFTTLQDAAAKLGMFTSQLSREFASPDASYSSVKMLRSSIEMSGMRHHLMKLKLAALHPIGADSTLQALHYFEARGSYAESTMKLLRPLAGGMTTAYTSLRVAQEEAKMLNQTAPELTLVTLMQRYCTENPNGPLGSSGNDECFEDTWMMYALYSFAFTIIDKVALAHDEVCRAETQVHLGNQSNCPAQARVKANCFTNEIEYCYSPNRVHSPELNQYTRCCCEAGAVDVRLTQFGLKKQRYATAACMASRLAPSKLSTK
eukprot:TRINITY_DN106507_c0_g1_i1.p1 TRINITY_DN106507_c0_g1~~TRINITY_DN106507_c0_g1_i1.p1  ORF type:complete len:460 (-),score=54.98 TRINITY_DN106507_c0_g1_i1:192-1475(-)